METNTHTVLLVDDETVFAQILSFPISDEGYAVDTAEDGVSALAALKHKRYDVVISDVRMPGMNGVELTRLIKREYPSTEIIILTAASDATIAEECVRAGAFDHFIKPTKVDCLLASIERALEWERFIHDERIKGDDLNEWVGMERMLEFAQASLHLKTSYPDIWQNLVPSN